MFFINNHQARFYIFSINSALTPDTHPELALGGYFGFGSNFTTNIDGRELTATSADGFVSNNRFGSDLFLVRAQNLSPDVIASAIGPFSLARLEFRMDDIDEEVFSDTALPLTTPPLNLFEEAGFFADYRTDSGFSNIVRGTVDQIAFEIIDDVPEPASLTLIGAGLFGLGMMRRRYKKAKTV